MCARAPGSGLGVSVNSRNLGNPGPLAVAIRAEVVSIPGPGVCRLHPAASSASEAFHFKDPKENLCDCSQPPAQSRAIASRPIEKGVRLRSGASFPFCLFFSLLNFS